MFVFGFILTCKGAFAGIFFNDFISFIDAIEHNIRWRLGFHLAAVFCNNFVNHLYALAERFCRTEEIDFNLLLPLIKETALRVNDLSPSVAQTGPAIRQDTDTIEKHLTLLKNYPQLTRIYTLLTESIFNNR